MDRHEGASARSWALSFVGASRRHDGGFELRFSTSVDGQRERLVAVRLLAGPGRRPAVRFPHPFEGGESLGSVELDNRVAERALGIVAFLDAADLYGRTFGGGRSR